MDKPWQCPACKTWMRPDVTEHRCPPDAGATASIPAVWGGGGGSVTTTWPGTVVTSAPAA